MPDTSGPWDGNPWAEADWFRTMAATQPSGVHGTYQSAPTSGPLAFAATGLTITPAAGNASVGGASYVRTAALTSVTTTANTHASFSRRDRLVARRSLATHSITLAVIVGTPAATPLAPNITRDTTSWDLTLFSFLVPPASGTTLSGVVDERVWMDPLTPLVGQGQFGDLFAAKFGARLPMHWGSGTVYPTANGTNPVGVGDTFARTDLAALMRWNGGAWRQLETAELPNISARDAINTAQIHPGFQALDTSTRELYRWNGAVWENNSPNGGWIMATGSTFDYNYGLVAGQAPTVLPGQQFNVYVPLGRTLEVEFRAGIFHAYGGFCHLRLYINGVQVDAQTVGGDNNVWGAGLLRGYYAGVGAVVGVSVTGECQSGGGDVRATPNMPNSVRASYHIA